MDSNARVGNGGAGKDPGLRASTRRGRARRRAKEIYVACKERLKSNPVAFSWLWRVQESALHHRRVVRPDFDIVIEGFPRSGNTFCTTAFLMSQGDPAPRVANHFHTPAQFQLAARWGIPALLVIREPRASVLSNAVFYGDLSVPFLIRRYIRFHAALTRWRASFVVGDFGEVTTDFGAVVARVNRRFKTTFVPFVHDRGRAEAVLREIDAHHDRIADAGAIARSEFMRTTPSEFKQAQRDALAAELESREAIGLLRQARTIYEELVRHHGQA